MHPSIVPRMGSTLRQHANVRPAHNLNSPVLPLFVSHWAGWWEANAEKEKALEIKGLSLILATEEA